MTSARFRPRRFASEIGADLAGGFGLLTRLPVGWLLRDDMPYRPGRAVWCYPLVGLCLGALNASCLLAGDRLGMPPMVVAVWTLLLSVWLTGGLHEDGLADLVDGCGGGRMPSRRLEIMRDSRIGAFGALALMLCLLVRFAALDRLAVLPAHWSLAWLPAVGALSRAAMLPVLALPPARADGLGRSLGRLGRTAALFCALAGVIPAVLLLRPRSAVVAIIATLATGWLVARFARSRLGGRTGDVLGATVMAAECVLLTLATSLPASV